MKDEENVLPRYLNESRAVITGFNFGIPKNLEIPDGILGIASEAFKECHLLESVTIPGTVYDIGEKAFYGCTRLKQVRLCEGVTKIHQVAFAKCPALESITIPGTVYCIGDTAFYGCTSLKQIKICEGVMEIVGYPFHECPVLESITIPSSLIPKSCFPKVKEICYGGTKAQWQEKWQKYFHRDSSHEMVIHCTDGDYVDVFVLPEKMARSVRR